MTRARDLVLTGALVLAAIGLTVALLEAALRLEAHLANARAARRLQAIGAAVPTPGAHVRLGNIIRVSPNPRIIYELIPNLDVVFLQVPLVTNADGFRGPAVPAAHGSRTVRIVGLGDSVMFGWGVRDEDGYLARLAAALDQDLPEVSWETVNTAVPGYNTVMEIETLREKGLRYGPDLVILNFVGNDLGLPNFIVPEADELSLRRSYLLGFVRSRLESAHGTRSGLEAVPVELRHLGLDGGSNERVPRRYRDLVGLEAWRRAMRDLAALAAQHAFEVVVLAHPEAPPFVKEAGRELGFPVVETAAAVREYERTAGVTEGEPSPLVLTPADPHPSARGHEVIARVLEQSLVKSGLAGQLIARRRNP
jgi:lysophospholipase L1-like esterase